MLLLAIDPGTTNFGFALANEDQRIIYARTVNLMQNRCITYKSIALAVCLLLNNLHKVFQFQYVCVEMQLREHMIGIMQSVCTWALMRDLSVEIVPATVWRKRIGLRNSGNYYTNKQRSVQHLRHTFGYEVPDHNAAEAMLMALGGVLPFVNPPSL